MKYKESKHANFSLSMHFFIYNTYNISTYSYLKHVNHFGQYPKRSERIQFPLKRNRFFYTNYTLQKNYNIWHIYFKDRTGTGWDISGKRRKCRRYSCSKARSRYVKTFVAYIQTGDDRIFRSKIAFVSCVRWEVVRNEVPLNNLLQNCLA